MLPFIPETFEQLQKRYKAAINKAVNAVYANSHPEESPGKKREHVFDFEDGIRLIISRDYAGNDEVFHISASVEGAIWKGPFDETLLRQMKERFAAISGSSIPNNSTFIITEKGIPHWFFRISNLN
jgi:hypothetical protein